MASNSEGILPLIAGAGLLWWLLSDDADGADAKPENRASRLARGGAGLGAGRLKEVERVRSAGTGDPTATPNQGGGDLIRGGSFGGAALPSLGAEFRSGSYVARDDRRSGMDVRSPSIYHLNGLRLTPDGLVPDLRLLPVGRPDPPVPARWIGGPAVDGGGLTTEGGVPAWRPESGSATSWLVPWVEAADVPGVMGGVKRLAGAFASKPLASGLMVPWVRVGTPTSAVRTGIDIREGDPIDGAGMVSEQAWIGMPAMNFRGIHTDGGETFVSQLGFVQYDTAGNRRSLRRYIFDGGTGKRYYLDGEGYAGHLARLDRHRMAVRAMLYSHGTSRGDPHGQVAPGPMPVEYMGKPSDWESNWRYFKMTNGGEPERSGVLQRYSWRTYNRQDLNLYARDITYKRAAYWFRRLMGGRANQFAPASLLELVETVGEQRRRAQQSFREVPKWGR